MNFMYIYIDIMMHLHPFPQTHQSTLCRPSKQNTNQIIALKVNKKYNYLKVGDNNTISY